MDIEIVAEETNPMLHRTDVRFDLTHDEATPSRLSVRDSLAAKLNKDSDEVVVHELDTKFGMRRTVGYAKVYDSPEFARDIEQTHMLDRNKIDPEGEDVEEGSGAGADADADDGGESESESESETETVTEAETEAAGTDESEADEEADEAADDEE